MTSLSTIGTNLYIDLVTTLKPQTCTLSVDSSSLGLKLANKSTVKEEEEQQSDLSNYYSALYESALFKEYERHSPVISSSSVVNTLVASGVNTQEAVHMSNALNEYYQTNAPRELTTVEVDV